MVSISPPATVATPSREWIGGAGEGCGRTEGLLLGFTYVVFPGKSDAGK